MKKLILSIAIVLGSFTAIATTVPVSTTEKTIYVQDFKEIKAEELPEAVWPRFILA